MRYIKEHKRLFYFNLLTSGRLNNYLANINEQAEDLFFRLIKQFSKKRYDEKTQKYQPNDLDWRNE